MKQKNLNTKVVVIYGGKSGEFEVSLRSASSVLRALSKRFGNLRAIEVDRKGDWRELEKASFKAMIEGSGVLEPMIGPTISNPTEALKGSVVFSLIHGTTGEDGQIQGFLEWLNIPYVGCGIASSSIGMDKDLAKRLVAAAGIPVTPGIVLSDREWGAAQKKGGETEILKFAERVGYPNFVKPCRSGSSVATSKVKTPEGFIPAVEEALRYDTKVLVEEAIQCREIELAVLERSGGEVFVSTPGELVTSSTHEFYSYEAKYLDENGAVPHIPALLSREDQEKAKELARIVFKVLECEGLARVDLFYNKVTQSFLFNEINTIPGFTSISMYPKMCLADGIEYEELVEALIHNAIEKFERRARLCVDLPKF